MDEKKICFILCGNQEEYIEECIRYIQNLIVPPEYEVELQVIRGATSMTSGYNQGMKASSAKYKVYLHQDVFIVNKNFIGNMMQVFEDSTIGMLGMVGSPKMPENGVMWSGERIGAMYTCNITQTGAVALEGATAPCQRVDAIDGMLMATQYDVPWREELFGGWDYYDVSQSYEMRRAGYQVVVPQMKEPWVLHDDGLMNLEQYFHWQKVFQEEYGNE